MGGSIWLKIKAEDVPNVKKFFDLPIDKETPYSQYVGIGIEDMFVCHVGFKKTTLDLEHQVGDLNDIFVTIVAREVAKRFTVLKIGADSVGWYENEAGPGYSYVDWIKNYGPYLPQKRTFESSQKYDERCRLFYLELYEGSEIPTPEDLDRLIMDKVLNPLIHKYEGLA